MKQFNDELDWMAFRYINDEMDAAEISEFESQLEIDQAARDSVERMVRLEEYVAAVGRDRELERSVNKQSGSMSVMVVLQWVVAASLIIGIFGATQYWKQDRVIEPEVAVTSSGDSLAIAWVESLDGVVDQSSDEPYLEDYDPGLFDDLEDPSWMVDAYVETAFESLPEDGSGNGGGVQ